jgi:hypothetical protein
MTDYEIPVPPAYRIHLTRIKAADMIVRTAGISLVTALAIWCRWWLLFVILGPVILLLIASCISWFSTLFQPWIYIIGDRGAHIIGTPLKPLWTWVDLSWSSSMPIEVAEEQWHGLPAISITTSQFGRCIMVYGPENAQRVSSEVLPNIRKWIEAGTPPLG